MTSVGKEILLPVRVARLVHALKRIGAEAEVSKIEVPSGEPPGHWYFVRSAGGDGDHVDPEAPFGHGTSFLSAEEALSRAFGEFTERYVLSCDDQAQFVHASYCDLSRRGVRALDPRTVAGLADDFRKAHPRHQLDENTVLAWAEGRTFPFWQKILVPAQLVYVPYASGRGEPRIRQPLTTGAAFGWTFSEALWRGLAEVIERDAFMIAWLARLAPAKIQLDEIRDPIMRRLVQDYERSGVKAHAFDITTDAHVPTALALLLDPTGRGPAVSVGCRTSFDPTLALQDAFRQCHGVRVSMTVRFQEWRSQGCPAVEIKDSIPNRVLFWSPVERIAEVEFLFASEKRVAFSNSGAAPGPLRSIFRAWRGLPISCGDLIIVDLTPPALKPVGRIVKAILPGAQPLHLSETYPNFGGTRWQKFQLDGTSSPNTIPHPFI